MVGGGASRTRFVKECTELKLLVLDSDTPTGVLERGFWDSLETAPHEARDCPSLRDRIRRLFSNEPVCAWNDDEWVTVRGNEVHDMQLEGEGLSFTKRTPLFVMKRMFW